MNELSISLDCPAGAVRRARTIRSRFLHYSIVSDGRQSNTSQYVSMNWNQCRSSIFGSANADPKVRPPREPFGDDRSLYLVGARGFRNSRMKTGFLFPVLSRVQNSVKISE